MRIGLYGIRGVYNFGCEAIIRGTRQFINDLFPEAKVVYFSYSYEFDKKALTDLDIEIISLTEKNSLDKRIINKILDTLDCEKRVFTIDIAQLFSDIDMIFSIGGDIYTIPEFLRKKKQYKYYNPLVDFCKRSKKTIVVFGASVGPWGNYAKAIEYYKKNLMGYKAILCRERETVSYLEELGFDNTCFFPDPAFQLGGMKNNNGQLIGINLSPLSLKEIYGEYSDKHVESLARLLDRIHVETGRDLAFLPHVLSQDMNDNDLLFLKKVKNKMDSSINVLIADTSTGFLGIKSMIRNCHIVIAARMHCAINAIEENVPTIFLSYSQKSMGMCEYVYGNKDWVLDISEAENKLVSMAKEMCSKRDMLSLYLNEQNARIKADYTENIEQIKCWLKSN